MKKLSLFAFGLALTALMAGYLILSSLMRTLEETDFLEDLEE